MRSFRAGPSVGSLVNKVLRFEHVSLIRRLLRARRPFVAGVLVASLVTTMLGPSMHADDGHDSEFVPAVVHDASQHRLTPSAAQGHQPPGEQHCVACHFVRLVRERLEPSLATPPVLRGACLCAERIGFDSARADGPPLPARAPPPSLFV